MTDPIPVLMTALAATNSRAKAERQAAATQLEQVSAVPGTGSHMVFFMLYYHLGKAPSVVF